MSATSSTTSGSLATLTRSAFASAAMGTPVHTRASSVDRGGCIRPHRGPTSSTARAPNSSSSTWTSPVSDERLRVLRMVMYAPAPPGTVFASVVIGDMVGRETPIKVWDDPLFIGTIEKAEIVDDGKAVKMIVSVRNMPPEL